MSKIKFGAIEILLPDANISYFFISEDFAGLLGIETNNEAKRILQKELKSQLDQKLYKRISFDQESSCVTISISKPDLMYTVAEYINQLINCPISEADKMFIKNQLISHKRPKKQKWKISDVFAIPLTDGSYIFGQIFSKEYSFPICTLFDIKTTNIPSLEEIVNQRKITSLTIIPIHLDNHKWKVIGNKEINCAIQPISPGSFSSGILNDLGEAYYGLRPWNVNSDPNYLDKLLLPEIKRPDKAIVLNSEERLKYRKEQGWE
ncbi:Imm26 family immunity protein [Ectobacillus panaciterrae]|uniref:Imm26 family immunity protein n=1 Tax=Ectobacillus panaciterrae TaxID=363872 RepID=UPI000415D0B8|nr:Imm26 family immunity protein [Ectobacillus panaciterrae]